MSSLAKPHPVAKGRVEADAVERISDGEIKKVVREVYTRVADSGSSCCGFEGAGPMGEELLHSLDYDLESLGNSLSRTLTESFAGCGNPVAMAELREGDVVLDLGSGAGLDCFLAARKVGPRGKVIGIDMTEAMVEKARTNQSALGIENVEFIRGEIESIRLPDESVDLVISNCVINLSPDKDAVFAEAHRVLRPGGRLYVSDIVTKGPLPPSLRNSLEAWGGCVAGALEREDYLGRIQRAGFEGVEVFAGKEVVAGLGILSAQIRAQKP